MLAKQCFLSWGNPSNRQRQNLVEAIANLQIRTRRRTRRNQVRVLGRQTRSARRAGHLHFERVSHYVGHRDATLRLADLLDAAYDQAVLRPVVQHGLHSLQSASQSLPHLRQHPLPRFELLLGFFNGPAVLGIGTGQHDRGNLCISWLDGDAARALQKRCVRILQLALLEMDDESVILDEAVVSFGANSVAGASKCFDTLERFTLLFLWRRCQWRRSLWRRRGRSRPLAHEAGCRAGHSRCDLSREQCQFAPRRGVVQESAGASAGSLVCEFLEWRSDLLGTTLRCRYIQGTTGGPAVSTVDASIG